MLTVSVFLDELIMFLIESGKFYKIGLDFYTFFMNHVLSWILTVTFIGIMSLFY